MSVARKIANRLRNEASRMYSDSDVSYVVDKIGVVVDTPSGPQFTVRVEYSTGDEGRFLVTVVDLDSDEDG